jgi:hypothetical protein
MINALRLHYRLTVDKRLRCYAPSPKLPSATSFIRRTLDEVGIFGKKKNDFLTSFWVKSKLVSKTKILLRNYFGFSITLNVKGGGRFYLESCINEALRKICQSGGIDEVVRLF